MSVYIFVIREREAECQRLSSELNRVKTENSDFQRRVTSLEGDLAAAQTTVTSLKCAVGEMSAAQEQKNAQIEVLKVWNIFFKHTTSKFLTLFLHNHAFLKACTLCSTVSDVRVFHK